jgi:hypothetical protein
MRTWSRTWARWRASGGERLIGIEDYEATGGFAGALNRHADELLNSDAVRADPKIAEILFKRLTALGRGNPERRDPAPLSEQGNIRGAESHCAFVSPGANEAGRPFRRRL